MNVSSLVHYPQCLPRKIQLVSIDHLKIIPRICSTERSMRTKDLLGYFADLLCIETFMTKGCQRDHHIVASELVSLKKKKSLLWLASSLFYFEAHSAGNTDAESVEWQTGISSTKQRH